MCRQRFARMRYAGVQKWYTHLYTIPTQSADRLEALESAQITKYNREMLMRDNSR